MTTTPAQALRAFEALDRPDCQVSGLLEDEHDYFASWELVPPYTEWTAGPGFAFVAKATGKLWWGAPGEVLDKIDAMAPVTPRRSSIDVNQSVTDE